MICAAGGFFSFFSLFLFAWSAQSGYDWNVYLMIWNVYVVIYDVHVAIIIIHNVTCWVKSSWEQALSWLFFLCVQLFDALIVIVSFSLDIVFRNREDAASGVGLLVILRLWRVARILNGGLSLFHPSSFVFSFFLNTHWRITLTVGWICDGVIAPSNVR